MLMDYRDTSAWQRVQADVVLTDPAEPVMLVDANPQRVGLMLSTSSPDDVFFSPVPDPAMGAGGILLLRTSAPVILDHAHHGALVQVAWYVWTAGSIRSCMALELIMDTPPTPFETQQRRNHAESGVPLHDAARP